MLFHYFVVYPVLIFYLRDISNRNNILSYLMIKYDSILFTLLIRIQAEIDTVFPRITQIHGKPSGRIYFIILSGEPGVIR